MKTALCTENVSFSYGGEPVLRNISLELTENTFLVLIGPNGGGKSTFLKLILGLLPLQSGTINVFGKPVHAAENIGYVPQDAGRIKDFPVNVLDTVMMGFYSPRVKLLKRKEIESAALNALELFGMAEYKNARLNELSTGQLQRTLLARAVAKNPALLAMDEPLSGVDPTGQKLVLETVKKRLRNTTVIFISHDLSVIPGNADAVGCINRTLTYHPAGEVTEQLLANAYGQINAMTLVSHSCRCEAPHD
ncbi:MAG: ATP-binding cassette domain-containing protein [Deferribacteraceae bacterium]|jgi:zinc transport system ATP-binding protein|nr:ATP-binding cassette domain-containing protein [Deferribacteraceae bacterium]